MDNEQTQAAGPQETDNNDNRIAELSKESASYRTQRNVSLRRAHAYETILSKHGIDISEVTDEKLSSLPISNGQVDGQFDYTPPKIEVPKSVDTQKAADAKPQLTLEEVRTWPADKINENWDQVKQLLQRR